MKKNYRVLPFFYSKYKINLKMPILQNPSHNLIQNNNIKIKFTDFSFIFF
jgi:hypothetical protein